MFKYFELDPQWADATLYLQMVAFYEGRLKGCRVHDPAGERVGCCCDHEGCCGAREEVK